MGIYEDQQILTKTGSRPITLEYSQSSPHTNRMAYDKNLYYIITWFGLYFVSSGNGIFLHEVGFVGVCVCVCERHENIGGVWYTGGYDENIWGYSLHLGDIVSTMGDIVSTLGAIMSTLREELYVRVFNTQNK